MKEKVMSNFFMIMFAMLLNQTTFAKVNCEVEIRSSDGKKDIYSITYEKNADLTVNLQVHKDGVVISSFSNLRPILYKCPLPALCPGGTMISEVKLDSGILSFFAELTNVSWRKPLYSYGLGNNRTDFDECKKED